MGRGRNVEKATPYSKAVTLADCLLCLPAAPPSLALFAKLSVGGWPGQPVVALELGAAGLCSGQLEVLERKERLNVLLG